MNILDTSDLVNLRHSCSPSGNCAFRPVEYSHVTYMNTYHVFRPHKKKKTVSEVHATVRACKMRVGGVGGGKVCSCSSQRTCIRVCSTNMHTGLFMQFATQFATIMHTGLFMCM